MLDSLIGPQRAPPYQPSTHTYRLSKFLKNPLQPQRRSEILTDHYNTVNSPASHFQPRNTRKTLPHSASRPPAVSTKPLSETRGPLRRRPPSSRMRNDSDGLAVSPACGRRCAMPN